MPYTKKPKLAVKTPDSGPGKRLLGLKRTLAIGFDWLAVDGDEMRCAFFAAGLAGAAIMISPAAGGRGVCLKLYVDDDKEIEYATTPDELNELMGQIVDQLQPDGQDLREVMKMTPLPRITERDLTHEESVHADHTDHYKGKRREIGS